MMVVLIAFVLITLWFICAIKASEAVRREFERDLRTIIERQKAREIEIEKDRQVIK
jgi:hypothetical protein